MQARSGCRLLPTSGSTSACSPRTQQGVPRWRRSTWGARARVGLPRPGPLPRPRGARATPPPGRGSCRSLACSLALPLLRHGFCSFPSVADVTDAVTSKTFFFHFIRFLSFLFPYHLTINTLLFVHALYCFFCDCLPLYCCHL